MNTFSTADFCDDNLKKNIQVLFPKFKNYGGKKIFKGKIRTIKLDRSNWGLIDLLKKQNGKGKVLVVDAQEAFFGIIGDKLSFLAEKAGYEAIILNGYVRDTKETKKFNIGLFALGTCPQRCFDESESQLHIELNFANVTFRENEYIYCDEDGIIVCDKELYDL